jgi:glycosyltransferase involved in cell wall biosynthesis
VSDAVPSSLVVLLASVLKPIDDTRMRGKFAETLRQWPGTTVHIAGRQAPVPVPPPAGIRLHAIFSGTRTSLDRLAAQWRYGRLLWRLQPDVVMVHAPELLPLTLLWQRLKHGRKFIYDIRENYALNVSTQGVYQGQVQRWLAAGLRRVETWAARRASALLLAEASYAAELPFLHELPPERVVILENKYQPAPDEVLPTQPRPQPALHEPLQLLYSGTISELNGVWEAVALTRQLAATWPGGAHCTIIGFCQQPALLARLRAAVAQEPAIFTLTTGFQDVFPVPHADIVATIGRSHLGLLPYRPHPSTERCRPTKLFEYLAHGLPVLIPANPLWAELVQQYGAGLVVDFAAAAPAAASIAAVLPTTVFYPHGLPTEVLWASEGKKLWHLLDSIF